MVWVSWDLGITIRPKICALLQPVEQPLRLRQPGTLQAIDLPPKPLKLHSQKQELLSGGWVLGHRSLQWPCAVLLGFSAWVTRAGVQILEFEIQVSTLRVAV